MSWIKNDNVVWEELDSGALLIDPKSGARWTLSAAASAAWQHCDGTRTLAEMATVLHQSRANLAELRRGDPSSVAPPWEFIAAIPIIRLLPPLTVSFE